VSAPVDRGELEVAGGVAGTGVLLSADRVLMRRGSGVLRPGVAGGRPVQRVQHTGGGKGHQETEEQGGQRGPAEERGQAAGRQSGSKRQ
jgi:hypothetical protein